MKHLRGAIGQPLPESVGASIRQERAEVVDLVQKQEEKREV